MKTYIAEVPAGRRTAIKKLRTLCKQNLSGYQECIEYGMPCYKRNGILEVSFANQKHDVSLYVQKTAVLEDFRGELSAASIGKSCVRFTNSDKIDFDILKRLL